MQQLPEMAGKQEKLAHRQAYCSALGAPVTGPVAWPGVARQMRLEDKWPIKGPEGEVTAKNADNCVYIKAKSSSQGVRLSPPAPGGVKVKLAK